MMIRKLACEEHGDEGNSYGWEGRHRWRVASEEGERGMTKREDSKEVGAPSGFLLLLIFSFFSF
jgi:hypothetical protein